MKRIFLFAALITGSLSFTAQAQVKVNVGINIGNQPGWGPAGYDHADYYYLPDMDVYYDVPQRQFIYPERGRWIYATTLPARYRNYDLYHSYKVVVNEPKPYLHNKMYKAKYSEYRGRKDQEVWRDKKEWQDNNNRGRGNGNGNGHGRGRRH